MASSLFPLNNRAAKHLEIGINIWRCFYQPTGKTVETKVNDEISVNCAQPAGNLFTMKKVNVKVKALYHLYPFW